MTDPADVPTIEEILDNYGVADYLDPDSYVDLLAELQDRDIVMRSDAANHKISQGYSTIINQV